jgi:DNA-binding transcriptional regulator of glucitol operon
MFRASLSPIFRSTKQLSLQHLVTFTPCCCLLLSWKSWNRFQCVVGGVHVSGVTLNHLQEHKKLHLQHLVTVAPYCCLLLSWKSWNRFECVVGGVHISGVTITHLQEHKTISSTASGNRCTVLLSAAIVEELEQV